MTCAPTPSLPDAATLGVSLVVRPSRRSYSVRRHAGSESSWPRKSSAFGVSVERRKRTSHAHHRGGHHGAPTRPSKEKGYNVKLGRGKTVINGDEYNVDQLETVEAAHDEGTLLGQHEEEAGKNDESDKDDQHSASSSNSVAVYTRFSARNKNLLTEKVIPQPSKKKTEKVIVQIICEYISERLTAFIQHIGLI
nr:unnamed protein product [Callosobruchus analis]